MRFGRLALLVGLVACVVGALYVAAPATPAAAAPKAKAAAASEEQRAARRIDALVAAGDIGRARDLAEGFLRRYPYSGDRLHIETLTGVRPRPPIPGE